MASVPLGRREGGSHTGTMASVPLGRREGGTHTGTMASVPLGRREGGSHTGRMASVPLGRGSHNRIAHFVQERCHLSLPGIDPWILGPEVHKQAICQTSYPFANKGSIYYIYVYTCLF
jgi:hypothetical protein